MQKFNDKVVCITGPCKGEDNRPCNGNNVKVEVKMLFDKGHRSLRRGKYRYVDDPKIDYVHTGINGGVNKAAKSILSGGINIDLTNNIAHNVLLWIFWDIGAGYVRKAINNEFVV